MAIQTFHSKLPASVMIELEKGCPDRTVDWTLNSLLDSLSAYLEIRELSYSTSAASIPKVDQKMGNSYPAKPPPHRNLGNSFHAHAAASSAPSSADSAPWNCIFCNQKHRHETCDRFKTIEDHCR